MSIKFIASSLQAMAQLYPVFLASSLGSTFIRLPLTDVTVAIITQRILVIMATVTYFWSTYF